MKKINFEKRICITCGKEMLNVGKNSVSQTKWLTRKYCSFECKKIESRIDYSKSKVCPTCETVFYRKENERGYTWKNKVFCSSKCANSRPDRPRLIKKCIICDQTFHASNSTVNACSRKCNGVLHSQKTSGDGHRAWNGGRVITRQGYVRLWVSDDSPYADLKVKGSNHVLEHRIVMSQMLERLIEEDEGVHHKNGIRDDNRPENLELRSKFHGVGATVHCPTCTCNSKVETIYLPDYNFN